MLSLSLLTLLATGTIEVLGTPAPFALEEGFVEALPDAPLVVIARDVGADEELVVELVRLGRLGRGRAKATVTVGDGDSAGAGTGAGKNLKRTLAVLAPTLKERKLGGAYASMPVKQRAPLAPGTSRVELRVDAPMAMRLSVEKKVALEPLALVPLTPTPAPPVVAPVPAPVPVAPVPVAPVAAPVTPPAPSATVAPTAAASPALPPAPPPAPSAPTAPTTPPAPPAPPAPTADASAPVVRGDARPAKNPWPRLLAEVHAGTAVVVGGLQTFVPAGGARVLLGPRDLDAALGVAVDFDGQAAFIDVINTGDDGEPRADTSGSWQVSSTRVRLEGHLGIGDLALFESRIGVTVGAGARFAWHSASLPGVERELFVVGATARVAPEAAFEAGPGHFAIAFPVDTTIDVSPNVQGFAPVAAGVFLGYRLDL